MIKPIETKYNGIIYRSRLEARWSVFFDTIGVATFYEYQGYELDDKEKTWYLPDFYIPEWKCFFEVKPPIKIYSPITVMKCYFLSRGTGQKVIIAWGGFCNQEYDIITFIYPKNWVKVGGLNTLPALHGVGRIGKCNDISILHMYTIELFPQKAIREWLFPLHYGNGLEFGIAKNIYSINDDGSDDISKEKSLVAYDNPIASFYNALFFKKFSLYTKAYNKAKSFRF